MEINLRYRNGEIDDDLPYVGVLHHDDATGLVYDEEGDAVDDDTLASYCEHDGKGDGDDE